MYYNDKKAPELRSGKTEKRNHVMRKKCFCLALWTWIVALAIFLFSHYLYHYTLPGGFFTTVWQPEPGKPMVTWLFAIWGVMFLFASVMSLLVGIIFFPKETGGKAHA